MMQPLMSKWANDLDAKQDVPRQLIIQRIGDIRSIVDRVLSNSMERSRPTNAANSPGGALTFVDPTESSKVTTAVWFSPILAE
jgi:hypothetical protein